MSIRGARRRITLMSRMPLHIMKAEYAECSERATPPDDAEDADAEYTAGAEDAYYAEYAE
eukprot:11963370-Alexandrium_andersonii.AAC.1